MGDEKSDATTRLVVGDPRTSTPEEIARTLHQRHAQGSAPPPKVPSLASVPAAARYQEVREIGRGGMGRVDEVFDSTLGRAIAQKAVLPGASELDTTLLVAEAQTCAQLEHPSVVPVYDIGVSANGAPFYTMRLVRGRTLRHVLRDNQTAPGEKAHTSLTRLLGILRQVCLAVDYAHSRGVVHRDLKPDNVIVGEFGEVYVLDWGIAHLVQGSNVLRATHDEVQAGSPGYMAPEQILRGAITPATDTFALGAILYEMLAGQSPFPDSDTPSILRRALQPTVEVPSRRDPQRSVTGAFDGLVASCLLGEAADRPTARYLADAIDQFLDTERANSERRKEADEHTLEGEGARAEFEQLHGKAKALLDRAEKEIAGLAHSASAESKLPAWRLAEEGRRLQREGAHVLARAEAAFTRAIGRVSDHRGARSGLAALHYRLFEDAEEQRDADAVARHLELARTYDDGALSLQLANEGALVVEATADAEISVARYETDGLLLRARPFATIHAGARILLEAGSYVVVARAGAREVRYPIKIQRAQEHRITLRIPAMGEVPEGMLLVPGGAFLSPADAKGRLVSRTLPDFAIGRFPVTFAEYTRFLSDLPAAERARRLYAGEYAPLAQDGAEWRLTELAVEGEARKRIPAGKELELPAWYVSYFDALAYSRWLSSKHDRSYRLPSDLEWEKALRGADGRRFSMGDHLDPSFAKLRESRPEMAQAEPVGTFPLDESPYGVRDLTGGVCEWTSSSGDGGAAPALEEEGSAEGDKRLVIRRGGSYGHTALSPHGMRATDPAAARNGFVGFRLALSLDSHGSSELVVSPMRHR